jgi:hypothetical protein
LIYNVFVPVWVFFDSAIKLCLHRWADGFEHDIVMVSTSQHQISEEAKKQRHSPPSTALWASEDGTIEVRTKPDRKPLIWIREKKGDSPVAQVCQIHESKFLDKQHGIDLMTVLAKEYANKTISLDNIYARRDELLTVYEKKPSDTQKSKMAKEKPSDTQKSKKEENSNEEQRGVRKRPAAAPTAAQPSQAAAVDGSAPVTPPTKAARTAQSKQAARASMPSIGMGFDADMCLDEALFL